MNLHDINDVLIFATKVRKKTVKTRRMWHLHVTRIYTGKRAQFCQFYAHMDWTQTHSVPFLWKVCACFSIWLCYPYLARELLLRCLLISVITAIASAFLLIASLPHIFAKILWQKLTFPVKELFSRQVTIQPSSSNISIPIRGSMDSSLWPNKLRLNVFSTLRIMYECMSIG